MRPKNNAFLKKVQQQRKTTKIELSQLLNLTPHTFSLDYTGCDPFVIHPCTNCQIYTSATPSGSELSISGTLPDTGGIIVSSEIGKLLDHNEEACKALQHLHVFKPMTSRIETTPDGPVCIIDRLVYLDFSEDAVSDGS